jgi:hypothetical protein
MDGASSAHERNGGLRINADTLNQISTNGLRPRPKGSCRKYRAHLRLGALGPFGE